MFSIRKCVLLIQWQEGWLYNQQPGSLIWMSWCSFLKIKNTDWSVTEDFNEINDSAVPSLQRKIVFD